jgi:hypothetical protein
MTPARVQPPPGLASDERELFLDIVLGQKAEHFQGGDVPMLSAYVRACVLEQITSAEMKRRLAAGEDVSRSLLDAHDRATKTMHMFSMRRRLSPQARAPHTSPQQNTRVPPTNVYDRMRMERGDGAEPT